MTVRGSRPQVNFGSPKHCYTGGCPVSPTEPAPLDGIARRFRAGEFEGAATATQALLEAAAQASRESLAETAEALLFRPELQPLFTSAERAAGAVPYFRWLCTALEYVLGRLASVQPHTYHVPGIVVHKPDKVGIPSSQSKREDVRLPHLIRSSPFEKPRPCRVLLGFLPLLRLLD